jgi:hypothetical protein
MERIDEACYYREKFGQKNVVQVVQTLGTGSFLFEITAGKLLCKGSIVQYGLLKTMQAVKNYEK